MNGLLSKSEIEKEILKALERDPDAQYKIINWSRTFLHLELKRKVFCQHLTNLTCRVHFHLLSTFVRIT